MGKYLCIDPDAIEPNAEELWFSILDAKMSLAGVLAGDLDTEILVRLTNMEAKILSLLARPARSRDEIRRKMTAMEFVQVYEPWFPTRAAAMGDIAIQADLSDLGVSREALMAEVPTH